MEYIANFPASMFVDVANFLAKRGNNKFSQSKPQSIGVAAPKISSSSSLSVPRVTGASLKGGKGPFEVTGQAVDSFAGPISGQIQQVALQHVTSLPIPPPAQKKQGQLSGCLAIGTMVETSSIEKGRVSKSAKEEN